ncbi:MAG TPA: hypothetical protein VFU38_07225 [Candidatus Krumholzibacteria bacterium]|nr:hypothetical protein [Candidatus Krumholzibacteria bacterium]
MSMPHLCVVPYQRREHEHTYLELLARHFGPQETALRRRVLAWIHERMPARERAPLRHVVVDREQVVASMGHLPAEFWIFGARAPIRFTHDLLVDEGYRGLPRLGRKLMVNALATGARMAGGLWMTEASYRLHLNAGFESLDPLTTYTLALDPAQFVAQKKLSPAKTLVARWVLASKRMRSLARANRTLGRADGSVADVQRFDPSLDDTWARHALGYSITRARDASYLNWRYADHPNLAYRFALASAAGSPSGYMVWRASVEGEGRAVVPDFLVERGDVDTFERLLSHVIVEASSAHCTSLSILTTQAWAARALREFGFFPRPSRNTWVVGNWQDRVHKESIVKHASWHVVLGDSDGDMWSLA